MSHDRLQFSAISTMPSFVRPSVCDAVHCG